MLPLFAPYTIIREFASHFSIVSLQLKITSSDYSFYQFVSSYMT